MFYIIEDSIDVEIGIGDFLMPDHTLKYFVRVRLVRVINDSRAVNEVDAFRERDILPDFGLTGNRRNFANLFLHQRIDDWGLADVRVADKTHRNALFVTVQLVELFQKLDQRTFAKGILHTGLESKSRSKLIQVPDPLLDHVLRN